MRHGWVLGEWIMLCPQGNRDSRPRVELSGCLQSKRPQHAAEQVMLCLPRLEGVYSRPVGPGMLGAAGAQEADPSPQTGQEMASTAEVQAAALARYVGLGVQLALAHTASLAPGLPGASCSPGRCQRCCHRWLGQCWLLYPV